MERNQQRIPGTEPVEIEEVTEAAESLRLLKEERRGMTAKIADATAHLNATVQRHIDEGNLKLPNTHELIKFPIYPYEDADGNMQSVKWSIKTKGDVSGHRGGVSEEEEEEF